MNRDFCRTSVQALLIAAGALLASGCLAYPTRPPAWIPGPTTLRDDHLIAEETERPPAPSAIPFDLLRPAEGEADRASARARAPVCQVWRGPAGVDP